MSQGDIFKLINQNTGFRYHEGVICYKIKPHFMQASDDVDTSILNQELQCFHYLCMLYAEHEEM